MSSRLARLSLALVCVGTAPASPRFSTIALSALVLPDDIENPDPVKREFETLVNALLVQEGFTVIPSTETEAIWKRLVDSVQGFYDPITGELVQAEYQAVAHGTLNELRRRFGVDGWLRVSIDPVQVRWNGGKAKWDGNSEGISRGSGVTTALSLVAHLADTLGLDVYIGRGGIQLAVKFDRHSQGQEVPREKLFADPSRNLRAVHLALDSLVYYGPHAPH